MNKQDVKKRTWHTQIKSHTVVVGGNSPPLRYSIYFLSFSLSLSLSEQVNISPRFVFFSSQITTSLLLSHLSIHICLYPFTSSPLPAQPSRPTLKQRKRCVFFRAATHRLDLTHSQKHKNTTVLWRRRGVAVPCAPPATSPRPAANKKSQPPCSSKATSGWWTSGILGSRNCWWQIVVFTYCIEPSGASGRCTPRKDRGTEYMQCREIGKKK